MDYNQIAALIPFYDTNGENSTCIIFMDGSRECTPCSVKKFMRSMLYDFHLDPHALRHWTFRMIGTKLNTPIIINDNLIFLPVKLRKGVGKQDGCFGYVRHDHIRSFANKEVTLSSGEMLATLSPKAYLTKKHLDANMLRFSYREFKKKTEFMYE